MRAYKGTDGGAAFCFSACDDHEASGYTPVRLTKKLASHFISTSYNTSLFVCIYTINAMLLQVFTGKNAGAMTYSFIKAVKTAGPAPTYGHLLNLMCSAIREAQSRLGDYASSDASAVCLLNL